MIVAGGTYQYPATCQSHVLGSDVWNKCDNPPDLVFGSYSSIVWNNILMASFAKGRHLNQIYAYNHGALPEKKWVKIMEGLEDIKLIGAQLYLKNDNDLCVTSTKNQEFCMKSLDAQWTKTVTYESSPVGSLKFEDLQQCFTPIVTSVFPKAASIESLTKTHDTQLAETVTYESSPIGPLKLEELQQCNTPIVTSVIPKAASITSVSIVSVGLVVLLSWAFYYFFPYDCDEKFALYLSQIEDESELFGTPTIEKFQTKCPDHYVQLHTSLGF